MESVRPPEPGDHARLRELWHEALAETADHRGGRLLGATLSPEAAPERAMADPNRIVVVGCIDDFVVGFASAHLERGADPPLAVVDMLYVEAPFREIGVGEGLAETVVHWATGLDCQGVDAPALPGNRRAKAFFEDNGFIARLLTMHRPLAATTARTVPLPVAGGGPPQQGDPRPLQGDHPLQGDGRPQARMPEPCVGAIALDGDQLLLIRRGRGAAAGLWSVPGGRIEQGETAAEAVLRELREETGLEAVCGDFVGWVERMDDDYHFVILDFLVTVLGGGEPVAGDDAAEVAWVPLAEVADYRLVDGLAEFLHDHGILRTIT